MENIIDFKNVTFGYGNKPVLKNFSLQIKEGTFNAIIGPNGSGKSTIARLINGLLVPLTGTVSVYGMNTKHKADLYNIRKIAAMVFQNPDDQIVCAIVEDEAAFGAENLGIPSAQIQCRVDEALKKTGLHNRAYDSTAHLSGGEKQRLAIAGALVMNPRILILDEPTSMLDPSGRKSFIETIIKLHESGITIILITHDMSEAALADRCIVMNKGEIVLDAAPPELFSCPDILENLSLELPPMRSLANELSILGFEIPSHVFTPQQMADYIVHILKS